MESSAEQAEVVVTTKTAVNLTLLNNNYEHNMELVTTTTCDGDCSRGSCEDDGPNRISCGDGGENCDAGLGGFSSTIYNNSDFIGLFGRNRCKSNHNDNIQRRRGGVERVLIKRFNPRSLVSSVFPILLLLIILSCFTSSIHCSLVSQSDMQLESVMLKRLESKFLNLFGMAKRPMEKRQVKVPKYLLDLYKKQTGSDLPTTNLNLPGRHTKTANTVRTFYHNDYSGNPDESTFPWKGHGNRIHFNLDTIPETEKVTGAELRVPFEITVNHDELNGEDDVLLVKSEINSVTGNEISEAARDNEGTETNFHNQHQRLKAVRILLHDVTKPASTAANKNGDEHESSAPSLLEPISYPIDSKTVVLSKRRNGTSSFWLTFDVFPAVARWMSNHKTNHGLVLEILGVTNEGQLLPGETVLQKHNLRVKRAAMFDEEEDKKEEKDQNESVYSSDGSGHNNGKGHNSIITPESSSSTADSSSASTAQAEGSTSSSSRSSPKSTQDSGESPSSTSSSSTPESSSAVVMSSSSFVSSSSPTEVGLASDDGFIKPNEIRRKKPVNLSHSIVLFTYSDDGRNPAQTRDAKTLSRHYRSAQQQRRRQKHRNKNRKRNLCQRHAMFVDFQDVGWNDWIVAPPGYAAYYCAGECPFPMAEHLNATNHAVIQALVHSMNPALVPPPCCVPTKYSALSLLYTDSSDKIVLKNYNEMVVDSCGCS